MPQGIAIIYKNGSKDWFDPVINEVRNGDILTITIENGYTYGINMQDVVNMSYYDIEEGVKND